MMLRINLKYLHPVVDSFDDICKSIAAAIPEEKRTKTSMKNIPYILGRFFKHMWADVTDGYSVGFHIDRLFTVRVIVKEIGIIPKSERRKRIFCSKAMGYSFEIDVIGRFRKLYKFKFTPDRRMLKMLWEKLDNTDIAYDLIKIQKQANKKEGLISKERKMRKEKKLAELEQVNI